MIINKEHNLYIIKSEGSKETLIKFGYSSDIKTRLSSYTSHNPHTTLLFTCFVPDGLKFEKAIHSEITADYKKEWYTEDKLYDILKYLVCEDNYTIYNDFKLDESKLIPNFINSVISTLIKHDRKISMQGDLINKLQEDVEIMSEQLIAIYKLI